MRVWTSTGIGLLLLAGAGDVDAGWKHRSSPRRGPRQTSFQRIATLPNFANNDDLEDETVSEIVAATADGRTLVYTDGTLEQIGLVDLDDPDHPLPAGKLSVGGEPTSVAILGDDYALVGVNTSASFDEPSGHLAVVDLVLGEIVAEIDLGGQPDAVAISPSGEYAAVVIENERDEDVEVDGVEGGLPQLPAGFLVAVDLFGAPSDWTTRPIDLSGRSVLAPEDPEPEFVDIDDHDQAVVSLQENNHILVVDLPSGEVVSDFSAGVQTLVGVDAVEDDVISMTDTLEDVPREPDAVTWIRAGHRQYIGTANEGDLNGGSRGFSLFDLYGNLVFDAGAGFDRMAAQFGHYPEARSENKGSEPEAIASARFGDKDYLFVGSERGSFVAVYTVACDGQPRFVQFLPAPLGPEGVLAIPSRGLLVVSGEEDDPGFGVRSSMMVYRLQDGAPTYPQIRSSLDDDGAPIGWSALSGMTGTDDDGRLLAVWDSFYGESRIFSIDVSRDPAVIDDAITIEGSTGNLDPEGIALAPDGTTWIASEGNAGSRPNRLLQTTPAGVVLREVTLPAEIEACRAASASTGSLGSGFEGVAVGGESPAGYRLLVAQQRGWNYTTPECEALDDDPFDVDAAEPGWSRIWTYDPRADVWGSIAYELEERPAVASWVGLSEITAVPGGYLVIERDNRTGDFAELKTLVRVRTCDLADGVITRDEKSVYDLIPDLESTHGWITDKPEGVAVTRRGEVFVVTDNDGVDEWSGETWFLRLGSAQRLFSARR